MEEIEFSVIIPAAGLGSRTGERVPKPWLNLAGEPMVLRTIRCFIDLAGLQNIALAVLPEELELRRQEVKSWKLPREPVVCPGGERRQDSVEAALKALNADDEELILVHDAARPFVTPALILDVANKALEGQVAIPAILSGDTLKEVDDAGIVKRTATSRHYLRAQTPQAIRAGVLRRGLALAQGRGIELTDEAGAAELLGFKVAIVPGKESNFKITTGQDLAVARFLLKTETQR